MEKKIRLVVTEECKGERIDRFLTRNLSEDHSRSFLQKLILNGNVLAGGGAVKRHHKVTPGEVIEVTVPEPVESVIAAEKIPLDIAYEDKDILVIDKPAGMVVHPAPGNYSGTLVNALLAHCKNLSGIGGVLKPGIVHRIDKGTSGLLVVAKSDEAHKGLAKQFKDKTVKRIYIAIVNGVVELDNGIVELPIGRSIYDRQKMAVNFDESKTAITQYRVLKRFKGSTLLELILGTGRTHQIRVHMAYIGHPVLGDEKYGKKIQEGKMALHARTLGFIHPITKKYMEFTSELPSYMEKMIKDS